MVGVQGYGTGGFDPYTTMMRLRDSSQRLGSPQYVQDMYQQGAQMYAPQQDQEQQQFQQQGLDSWRNDIGLQPMYINSTRSLRSGFGGY